MAITLGQGFMPYVLADLKSAVGQGATPEYKLQPTGFMNFLLRQPRNVETKLNNAAGHKMQIQKYFRQPYTVDFVDTTKSCDQVNVPARLETSVDISNTVQFALYYNDETIAQYENEASNTIAKGQPASPFMQEMVAGIVSATRAMTSKMNSSLVTLMSTKIGVNRVTGNNSAKTININKDETINPLAAGLTEIMSDYKRNLMDGRPQVIGGGLFDKFISQQAAKSFSQSGLSTSALVVASGLDFNFDMDVETILGTNNIIVAEPGAVQLVEYLEYTGFKAGVKPGASSFGIIPIPVQVNDKVEVVMFDYQLSYVDCPTTMTDAYYGTSLSLGKGWRLILSKQFGLFTIPTNAYRGTDVLNGNRGTLRYNITNTCETC